MMMDSMSHPRASSNDSDTQEDLKSVFKHPAGLQTARDLVQLVAKHMFNKPTQTLTNDTTSPMPTFPEASPEVEGILRDILAFSDLQARTSQQEELSMADGALMDLMDINAEESLHRKRCRDEEHAQRKRYRVEAHLQSVTSTSTSTESSHRRNIEAEHRIDEYNSLSHPKPTPLASSPSVTLTPLSNQLSLPAKSVEREIRSIFGPKMANKSLSQGTESPYRVESPAVRTSTAASQSPAERLTDNPHQESALKADNHLEQLRASKSSLEIARVQENTVRAHLPTSLTIPSSGNFAQIEATTPITLNPLPHAGVSSNLSNVSNIRPSPTIKSFLPVNKSIGHNTSANGDNRNHHNSPVSEQSSPTSTITSSQLKKASHGKLNSSLRSPSPSTLPATTQFEAFQTVFDLSSPNNTDGEVERPQDKMKPQKRKVKGDGAPRSKKQKGETKQNGETALKPVKPVKRIPKSKQPRPEPAKYRLGNDLWMRILEFTPPQFLRKARFISKGFKDMVDRFDSIYTNCRMENYGWDMPSPPSGLTERQYSDLFGGKGCLEPGCSDKKASRTHWSWAKRWCHNCWKGKIEREDRALKRYQSQYGRATLTKMFECIPVGMHDSFLKPHDYVVEDGEPRARQAPRLYKYYLSSEIQQIISDYEALTPPPYTEDPNHTTAEKSAALAAHQALMDALEEKRNEFFAARKKLNDDHMAKVQMIETAVRNRREQNRHPYDRNRAARRELFLRRAQEDLHDIDPEFIKKSKAFKAATRIFRDKGSERGWQALKPKIVDEWNEREGGSSVEEEMVSTAVAIAVITGQSDNPEPPRIEDNSQDDVVPDPFPRQNPMFSDVRRSMMMQQTRLFPPQPPFVMGSLATSSSRYSTAMTYGNGNNMVASASGHSSYPTPPRSSAPQNFNGFMAPTSFNNPNSRNTGSAFPSNAFASQYQQMAQPSSSNYTTNPNFHNPPYHNSTHISINSLLTGSAPPPQYHQNPNNFG